MKIVQGFAELVLTTATKLKWAKRLGTDARIKQICPHFWDTQKTNNIGCQSLSHSHGMNNKLNLNTETDNKWRE